MSDTKSFLSQKILRKQGIYILDEQDSEELFRALEVFKSYYKIESIIHFFLLGLPTLKTIVITQWNHQVKDILEKYRKCHGFTYFTLRSDRKNEVPNAPRLGLNVTLQDIERNFLKYLKDGRVLLLLEPRSRYDDLYSFNLLFYPDDPIGITMEVVGPGFDASDLKRGDVSPHERIWLPRSRPLFESKIKRELQPKSYYRESVNLRLEKIGKEVALLRNIETLLWNPSDFKKLAREYLSQKNETLLFQYIKEYPQMPIFYLKEIHNLVSDLPERMKNLGIRGEPFVLCGSIFNLDKKIGFWEFTWPELKYEGFSKK